MNPCERSSAGDGNQHGGLSCLVVERRLGPSVRHGRAAVGELAAFLEESVSEASLVTGGAAPRSPLLFLDLETTGLSGGAGTYPFLVGCGSFDHDGGFITRQYVRTRPSDERALLAAVAAEFGRAGALVTFNGKAFDAPLLETRYLFHRLAWPAGQLPHVDVLHPARLFWHEAAARRRMVRQVIRSIGEGGDDGGCSSGAGTHAARANRSGDVPGSQIPSRYFEFLSNGDAEPLEGVLEHNRLDLLSLPGLPRGC